MGRGDRVPSLKLKRDLKAVGRELLLDLGAVGSDLTPEMRQEQTAALEPLAVLLDVEVAHVLGHRGRERRALAEKEVGAARSAEEVGGPRGVAGVDEGAIL